MTLGSLGREIRENVTQIHHLTGYNKHLKKYIIILVTMGMITQTKQAIKLVHYLPF